MPIQIEGYTFLGPYYHTRLFDKDFGCVYILVDSQNRLVDVGQTGSVNSRIINHERKMCWIKHGCAESGLYVYISPDENFRLLLEKLIRTKYRPFCGEM